MNEKRLIIEGNLIRVEFAKSRTESGQKNRPVSVHKAVSRKSSSASKSTLDYWLKAVRKRKYSYKGERRACSDFSVRLEKDGEAHDLSLETSNRAEAAAKAKQIWESVCSKGWQQTLAGMGVKTKGKNLTLGDYLQEYIKMPGVSHITAADYRKKVRELISEVAEIARPESRKIPKSLIVRWQKRVDAVKLASLTDQRFIAWREKCRQSLERGEACGHMRTRTSATSVNGLIRAWKSIFKLEQREKFAYLDLPDPVPGLKLKLLRQPSSKYKGGIDAQALLNAADLELRQEEPEAYKLMLLCLTAGLRRSEADLLLWDSFDFQAKCIHVEPSKFYELKSLASEGVVYLTDQVAAFFQECYNAKQGEFVLESPKPARRHEVSYRYYRAEKVQEVLLAWLRGKGIQSRSPLHTLRKEYGSIINQKYGIYAASSALRHSTVIVTEGHYICPKEKPIPDITIRL